MVYDAQTQPLLFYYQPHHHVASSIFRNWLWRASHNGIIIYVHWWIPIDIFVAV
jgi:hypothetical protein